MFQSSDSYIVKIWDHANVLNLKPACALVYPVCLLLIQMFATFAGRMNVCSDSHIVRIRDQQSGGDINTTMLTCCAWLRRVATLFAAHLLASCTGRKIVSSDSHIAKVWDQNIHINCAHVKAACCC